MLQNMHIKNIALIDEIDINFEDRLNILTGETGAGKSIIIGSLGICLGGRFHKELLRDDTKDGLVELLFSLNDGNRAQMEALGIDCTENELLISRRLSGNGKTVSRINGETVTTATLKQAAALLIDLHAQHEQQTLLNENKHLEILDRFGGDNVSAKKEQVKLLYNEYTELSRELKEAAIDEAEKNRQIEFLKFQIDEIDNARLKCGEDEELEAYYKKASNGRELISAADEIYQMTGSTGDASAGEQIGHSIMLMKRMLDIDPELQSLYDTLISADDMLSDFNRELSSYMKSMEFDDKEFAEAQNRLDRINSLKLKYGNTIEAILECRDAYEQEYGKLIQYDEYISGLKDNLSNVEKRLKAASEELSNARQKEASKLCGIIKAAMEELNFMTVSLEMRFNSLDRYTANGTDEACFMISTNIGEPIRPLSDVASGGELSRIMLAIKSCLAREDDTPTLVFDEIDVGISGRTAQSVAEKLSVIAGEHQVICITHLPQIAAMADSHYLIEKNVENNKTITNIRKLSSEEEINEIARLIGGAQITEATIVSAREMKGLADREKLY